MNYYCLSEKRKVASWHGIMATLRFIMQKARSGVQFRDNHIKITEVHGFRAARGNTLRISRKQQAALSSGKPPFSQIHKFHAILVNAIKNWNYQDTCVYTKTLSFTEQLGIS